MTVKPYVPTVIRGQYDMSGNLMAFETCWFPRHVEAVWGYGRYKYFYYRPGELDLTRIEITQENAKSLLWENLPSWEKGKHNPYQSALRLIDDPTPIRGMIR